MNSPRHRKNWRKNGLRSQGKLSLQSFLHWRQRICTRIGGYRRPLWQQMQQQGRRSGRRKEPSGQARNWPKGRRKPAFFDVISPTRFGLFCWIPLFWTGERERFENWLLRFTTNGPSPACQFLRMLWKKRGAL